MTALSEHKLLIINGIKYNHVGIKTFHRLKFGVVRGKSNFNARDSGGSKTSSGRQRCKQINSDATENVQ